MPCDECEELKRTIRQLSRACQIFTSGLGDFDGYYPNLGQPLTQEALKLMDEVGLEPVFFWETRNKQDPFTKV